MNYILFDEAIRTQLLPFTHTRPIADIRCGIYTMRERWEACLQTVADTGSNTTTGTLTEPYLQDVFATGAADDALYINGAVFATAALAAAAIALPAGHALVSGQQVVAAKPLHSATGIAELRELLPTLPTVPCHADVMALKNVWDIFALNDKAIRADYELLTKDRQSAAVPQGVTVTGGGALFIEEGAVINAGCIINAAAGPVYIAAQAEVLEGVLIRGPLAVCGQSVIKMGAKIYGATTIGPGCKVGGEINNVIFFANSNKAHDGYLGNAVIGEWCNIGADTNCSNLKNNYADVKIWSEALNRSVATGLTFCGLMMGDHSKCGINTMFNTGTVVGVSCNIFGTGFPERFVPSFTWGATDTSRGYSFTEAMDTAGRMMARRGKKLSDEETAMYKHIYNGSKATREKI